MVNFHMLTKKLMKGIWSKYDQRLLYAEEQKISENTGGVYTEYRVYVSMPTEKYNEMHPENPLNPNLHKSAYAKILLKRTVKIEELFLYLLHDVWEKLESGEMYEQGERAKERIRSGRVARKHKGTGGSAGVLQNASIGEELPGGVSGDKPEHGTGEGKGDTVEA